MTDSRRPFGELLEAGDAWEPWRSFGPALLVLRGRRNWTREEVARRVGVTPSEVERVELGMLWLTPQQLARYVEALRAGLGEWGDCYCAAPGSPAEHRERLYVFGLLHVLAARAWQGPSAITTARLLEQLYQLQETCRGVS